MPRTARGQARAFDSLRERLLTQRNRRMLERLLPRRHEGIAFVAVAAACLPGEQGLLRLLQQRCWRVSPGY